ncbi:MAG: membrane protein insertase YidC [Spirochaetales bacterium]|nr:membrane protein insertase YidC [Spirochaetales bacterium]
MDKNVVLAVILSFAVIMGFTFMQQRVFPQNETTQTEEVVENLPQEGTPVEENTVQTDASGGTMSVNSDYSIFLAEGESPATEQIITMNTDLYEVKFSTKGAVVSSLTLNDHAGDDGTPVNMVYPVVEDRSAFEISFGENYSRPLTEPFYFEKVSEYEYHFYQTFVMNYSDGTTSAPFTITKQFRFVPDEYMMELTIEMENSVNEYIPLNYDGISYTLTYGPQIGPDFEKLDGRYYYRQYQVYKDEKVELLNRSSKTDQFIEEDYVNWAALSGKYFSVAAITDSTKYKIIMDNEQSGMDDKTASYLSFARPSIGSSKNSDVYHFYIGPKDKKILSLYNNSMDNSFNYSNLELDELAQSSGILAPIEWFLKLIIELVYKVIPNYGIAIIIMTLLIKIALFPVTHKSYESTAKMQEIQPMVKELQEKYKDDPQKLNVEMSKVYKEQGVNPVGGCLPMLLQMPILFAVYGMLNRFFDLRGAVFIPGWINDLSSPESVWNFAPVSLPLNLGSDLRLLPIIYVATQLLSMRFGQSQSAAGQSGSQQKMMMYGMPAMFFFVLYNVPSGLLIYWITMNAVTTLQQQYITRKKKIQDGLIEPKRKKGGK